MSDDRELLELAAKAAGLPYPAGRDANWWNPLRFNVPSKKLQHKLGIKVSHHPYSVGATAPGHPESIEWLNEFCWAGLSDKDKRETATRRAIVRAAAAIGKQTP